MPPPNNPGLGAPPSPHTDASRELSCLYLNARSLRNKIDELRALSTSESFDIIAITETFLDTHNIDLTAEYQIDNFKLFTKDRQGRRGGGVAMYVRHDLNPVLIANNEDSVEHLAVLIETDKIKFYFSVVYRPPGQSLELDALLYNGLSILTQRHDSVILGDFNLPHIDWQTLHGVEAESHRMIKFIEDNYLFQLVSEPTRENNILDLLLTTQEFLLSNVRVGEQLHNCDHNVIRFTICAHKSSNKSKRRYLNFNQANFPGLRHDLMNLNFDCPPDSNISTQWDAFKCKYLAAQQKHVPVSSGGARSNNSSPWFNSDIKASLKERNRLYTQKKCNPTPENVRFYNDSRRRVKRLIRTAKRNFEISIATEAKHNSKIFYKYINSRKQLKSGIGPLRTANGNIITNNNDMATLLNNFFSSVFTKSGNLELTPSPVSPQNLSDFSINTTDVTRALNNLNINKSPGPDQIYPRVLKETKDCIVPHLLHLFNESISQCSIPSEWKLANLSPIFKKGDRSQPGNYRPISLTSVVGKLLETILRDKIVDFLECHNLIINSQHGFRRNRSCLTNLLEFYSKLFTEFDAIQSLDIIFLDFQKAFDKIPHDKLLFKVDQIGIRGKALDWISDWLRGRKQRVLLNGATSDWTDVTSGVPQGSVLGPVLFLIYINDIDCNLNNIISKFADDTKIGKSVISQTDRLSLQNDLNNIVSWSEQWQMPFNVDKCQVLHVGRLNKNFNYHMAGSNLNTADKIKDLGVTITSNLKFTQQCINSANKANRMLGFIKRNFTYKSKDIILPLYLSLVRPHLEYAVQFWAPYLQGDIKRLEAVQRRATKLIPSLSNKSYEERLTTLGLFSLTKRRLRGKLIECFKILKGFDNINYADFFTYDPNTRTRNNGMKLQGKRVNLDLTQHFFTNDVINHWNRLPESVVQSSTIATFKSRLDAYMANIT